MSKSLASALNPLGFEKEAKEVDCYGEEILKGAVVDALDCVMQQTQKILPRWVVIERIPKCFNWQKDLLDERHLLWVSCWLQTETVCMLYQSMEDLFTMQMKLLLFLCVERHLITARLQQK